MNACEQCGLYATQLSLTTADRDGWAQRCQESEQREVNLRLANDVLHNRLRVDWAKYAPAAQAEIERLDAERIRLQSLCFTHVEARDAALKRVAELEAQLAAK
jgi:hypothetical protein